MPLRQKRASPHAHELRKQNQLPGCQVNFPPCLSPALRNLLLASRPSALCLSPRPNPFPCGWTRHSSILYRAFPWPGGSHHSSEQRRGGDALLLPSLLHRRCCELHQISIRTRPDARYICVGGDAYTNRWANIRSLYRYITSRVVLSSSTPSCLSVRCIASLGPHTRCSRSFFIPTESSEPDWHIHSPLTLLILNPNITYSHRQR